MTISMTSGAMLGEIARFWAQTGIALLIQSTLLLLAGLAAGYAIRRRGPGAQCMVYQVALAAVLLCWVFSAVAANRVRPMWTLCLPTSFAIGDSAREVKPAPASLSESPRRSAAVSRQDVPRDMRGVPVTVEVQPMAAKPAGGSHIESRADPFQDYLRPGPMPPGTLNRVYVALMSLWLLGAACLLAWLGLCAIGVARIRRRSTPADADSKALLEEVLRATTLTRRAPQLLVSADVKSVFLTGIRRPAILLPESYRADFDGETLRAIFAHELAHLERADLVWTLLGRILCAFGWMQPLLWILFRRWEQASEEACDLAVAKQGVSVRAYADCLLRLAERLIPARSEQALGVGIVTFHSSLGRRIERLLAARPDANLPQSFRIGVGVGMSLIAIFSALLIASAVPDDNALANDARLGQRVMISAEGIALGDLLPLVSEKTGVAVSANKEMADEKVIVLGPARPLKETLTDLAALFNGYWSRGKADGGKTRYELIRDLRTKTYEERLAHANEERLLAQLEEQVRALGETQAQLAKRPENDPIRKTLSNPAGQTNTRIYALLSPEKRRQLIEKWHVTLPVSALTEPMKDQIEYLFNGEAFKPERTGGFKIDEIARDKMDQYELGFDILGNGDYGYLSVYMTAPRGFNTQVTNFDSHARFVLPPHGNPYTGEKVGEAGLPDPKIVQGAGGSAWPDKLKALAEKTGRPVLSDCYRSKPVITLGDNDESLPPDTPMGALDAFCRSKGYLWWTRGKTLLFRKRDWYNQRLYEVPDRWVDGLSKRLVTHDGVPTYADLLTLRELTLDQIAGLNTSAKGFADRRLIAGFPEMLDVLALTAGDKDQPVNAKGPIYPDRKFARLMNLSDPRQRAVVSRFIEVSIYGDRFKNADPDNFGFIILAQRAGEAARALNSIELSFSLLTQKNTLTAGYLIHLPLVLPDDRRDKTKVEVTR